MQLELGISGFSISGDWLEFVVAHNPGIWMFWTSAGTLAGIS
jgi:hypothetical protein